MNNKQMEEFKKKVKEHMAKTGAKYNHPILNEEINTHIENNMTREDVKEMVDKVESKTKPKAKKSVKEIKSIMTRIGTNATLILAGDICQASIDGISGLAVAQAMARDMDHIGWIDFDLEDCVRSGACYENIKWLMENGYY